MFLNRRLGKKNIIVKWVVIYLVSVTMVVSICSLVAQTSSEFGRALEQFREQIRENGLIVFRSNNIESFKADQNYDLVFYGDNQCKIIRYEIGIFEQEIECRFGEDGFITFERKDSGHILFKKKLSLEEGQLKLITEGAKAKDALLAIPFEEYNKRHKTRIKQERLIRNGKVNKTENYSDFNGEWIIVEFTITKQGKVKNLNLLNQSKAGLYELLLKESIEDRLYEPAEKNGQAIDKNKREKITFKISD